MTSQPLPPSSLSYSNVSLYYLCRDLDSDNLNPNYAQQLYFVNPRANPSAGVSSSTLILSIFDVANAIVRPEQLIGSGTLMYVT